MFLSYYRHFRFYEFRGEKEFGRKQFWTYREGGRKQFYFEFFVGVNKVTRETEI